MAGREAFKFTKSALRNLEAPDSGRRYVYDSQTPSLALCITKTGQKTFYRCGRVHGRYQRIKLGTFPELSVENARTLANQKTGAIAEGRDPQQEKQEARQEPTLRELFDAFMDKHAKPYRKEKTWSEYEKQFNRYLKRWEGRRLSTIDEPDVQALHTKLGHENGKYTANRVLALLSAMFNKARTLTGWKGDNPCRYVTRFPEQSRDRFLQPDELKPFFDALAQEPNETIRDYFTLSLLIGARRSNMLAMRWDELNLDQGLWRLPDSKGGKPLILHLTEPAVKILKRRQERANGSPFVFPGRGKTGHLVEPKMAWQRILNRSGLKDVRVHDLRRSLGSYMTSAGASLPIVGKALGHKSTQATQVYARLTLDPVAQAVDTAAKAMLEAGGMTPTPTSKSHQTVAREGEDE